MTPGGRGVHVHAGAITGAVGAEERWGCWQSQRPVWRKNSYQPVRRPCLPVTTDAAKRSYHVEATQPPRKSESCPRCGNSGHMWLYTQSNQPRTNPPPCTQQSCGPSCVHGEGALARTKPLTFGLVSYGCMWVGEVQELLIAS